MRAILRSASASSPERCSSLPIAAATRVSQSSIASEHNRRPVALPRSLWLRSPLALLRHPAVLAGVAAASFLASVAAASAPLLRAGAESEALKRTLADLTPLGAGLTVETGRNPVAGDDARRAAARRLARTFPHVGAPVLTVSTDALLGGKVLEGGRPLEIVPMARAGATAHVRRLAGGGDGAWIAQRDAEIARVAPGGRIELVGGPSLRVGAVYRQLDEDLDNPYWVNFIARIRSPSPDPPPRPSFLLVGRHELYRIARATANGLVEDTFEYPVDVRSMTPARAKRLAARGARPRDRARRGGGRGRLRRAPAGGRGAALGRERRAPLGIRPARRGRVAAAGRRRQRRRLRVRVAPRPPVHAVRHRRPQRRRPGARRRADRRPRGGARGLRGRVRGTGAAARSAARPPSRPAVGAPRPARRCAPLRARRSRRGTDEERRGRVAPAPRRALPPPAPRGGGRGPRRAARPPDPARRTAARRHRLPRDAEASRRALAGRAAGGDGGDRDRRARVCRDARPHALRERPRE